MSPKELALEIQRATQCRDWHRLRWAFVKIAEDNYTQRNNWPTPSTTKVTYDMVRRWPQPQGHLPTISLCKMETADALLTFAAAGERVCGLNFANGSTPGGGYKTGASAQEEDCCRRMPTLYTSLLGAQRAGYYPFGPSTCKSRERMAGYCDVLYTPCVFIARRGASAGYEMIEKPGQYRVSMVAAAAPNTNFATDICDRELILRAMRSIFMAPKKMDGGITTLVLGAWGCGAFGGDPSMYAELFSEALVRHHLGDAYKRVHFAIPPGSNHAAFRATFARLGLPVVEI